MFGVRFHVPASAKELPLVRVPDKVPFALKVNTNGRFVKLKPGTSVVPVQVVPLKSGGGAAGSGAFFLQELANNAIDAIATKNNFFMILFFVFVYTNVAGGNRQGGRTNTEKAQVFLPFL